MTQQLEIEGTWEEILAQSDRLAGHRVRVIIFPDEAAQSPEDSFRQAWREVKMGKVQPVSELWDGIDAE
jgi:hypothetical protein